jgi:hypothetical protein
LKRKGFQIWKFAMRRGLDQIGEEGLKDKVNNHYLEICFAVAPLQNALTFAHDSLLPTVPERDFQDP